MWWPLDYFASRKKFIEQAHLCGAQLDSHDVNVQGPNGKALTIDVATLIADTDTHRIILTSGLHGVEGFIGAAIQIRAFETLSQDDIPKRTGFIFIHAANPWGFAHLRRVDQNNVDVNRNFFDFSSTHPSSPERYAMLDPVINPATQPSLISDFKYWSNAVRLITQHRGIEKLAGPIAAGQCDFPKGLFFSGKSASASCRFLQSLVLKQSTDVECITILDVHSGLGTSGKVTLIANTNRLAETTCLHQLKTHYQQSVILDNGSGNAYQAQGSWSQWCQASLSDNRFLYLCVEIGTVNPLTLFSALKRENQAYHWSGENTQTRLQSQQTLLDVFAPRSPRWRASAIEQGTHTFARTLSLM